MKTKEGQKNREEGNGERRKKKRQGVMKEAPDCYRTISMLREDVLYGLLCWPTVRPIAQFFVIFRTTFPDTYNGKLVTT